MSPYVEDINLLIACHSSSTTTCAVMPCVRNQTARSVANATASKRNFELDRDSAGAGIVVATRNSNTPTPITRHAGRYLFALHQRLHRIPEPRDGYRKHPPVHDPLHVLDRRGPGPVLLGNGIEPGGTRPRAQHPQQPFAAGLVVPVLDAAARLLELVRAHRRIAHEDQL